MTTATPHVGVRTFLDQTAAQPLNIADLSSIGIVAEPDATIDRDVFGPDQPVAFTTDSTDHVTAAGTGSFKRTLDAIAASGIVATVVATVPADFANNADASAKMARMVGSAASHTGAYALFTAEAETGVVPDLLIGPGYTSQRLGNAANPLATAFDAIADRLITPIAVCQVPSTTKEDAVAWAADFEDSLNVVAIAQAARVLDGSSVVNRDIAPFVASLIAATDKDLGGPYYSPGNRELVGILGPSRSVGFSISDPDSEANYLLQRGVNSVVQLVANRTRRPANGPAGKIFWGFFNTSADVNWRMINVVRTRKAVREVIPRTLAKYVGKNLGAHVSVLLLQGLADFLSELKSLPVPAILPASQVRWDPKLNDNATLRSGGFVIDLKFEEAPAITDIQVYTGRYEAAFTVLASEIQAAMAQAGVTGAIAA